MPNQPIPESIDAQLPSGTRLRFCFDEPLMSSVAGLLLLAEHAACSGDIARIATALSPELKVPAPVNASRARLSTAPLSYSPSLSCR